MRNNKHEEAEVTPGEDLMQEHGVLERIRRLYDEAARRIEHAEQFDLAPLTSAGGIVRRFVEDYHENLEEQFVFPRLQTARREGDLVAVLIRSPRSRGSGRRSVSPISRASRRLERSGRCC